MPTRALVTRHVDDLRLFPDRWHLVGLVFFTLLGLGYPFLADAHWLAIGHTCLVTIVGSVALMVLTGFAGQISLGHAAFLALGAYTAGILGVHMQVPFWLIVPAISVSVSVKP
mgnify:CR=1 FL=1